MKFSRQIAVTLKRYMSITASNTVLLLGIDLLPFLSLLTNVGFNSYCQNYNFDIIKSCYSIVVLTTIQSVRILRTQNSAN